MLRFARTISLVVACVLFACPSLVSAADNSGLVNGILPSSTGTKPPPVDDNDYKPYFSGGTSEIVLKPTFTLADGSTTACRPGPGEEAVLYPATDFTVWIVENWISRLQTAKIEDTRTAYPGSNLRGLPDYLDYIKARSLVRTAQCDADHEFVFTNVPVGTYVMYAQHMNFVHGTAERYNSAMVQTPDGLRTETLPGQAIDVSHSTDGYLSYVPNRLVVDRPARRYTVNAEVFNTVVHFKVDHS